MKHFHIVFLDAATPGYYDTLSLEQGTLGGTESSVLRLAEGLGKIGLRVAVVQKIATDFAPISADHCLILPAKMIPEISCDVVVHLRSVANLELWPKARQFVWLHDDPAEKLREWINIVSEHKATIIGVSQWQVEKIKQLVPEFKVVQLYSPVDEKTYVPIEQRPPVDINSLVWNASPHKGLQDALPVFRKLRKEIPSLSLTVMNPGYYHEKIDGEPGLIMMGDTPKPTMRQIVQRSLCLFYPTQFRETFGLIGAEAEAMGVPVATYKIAALAESVRDSGWRENEEDLISTIKQWHKNRPTVNGQERFRIQNLLESWVRVLDGKMPASD